jgi:hypothetical protein
MELSNIANISGTSPEPKSEFKKLTQPEEVDKFLRFLHISPGEQFIISLRGTGIYQQSCPPVMPCEATYRI